MRRTTSAKTRLLREEISRVRPGGVSGSKIRMKPGSGVVVIGGFDNEGPVV
jgi:hypothetical protein